MFDARGYELDFVLAEAGEVMLLAKYRGPYVVMAAYVAPSLGDEDARAHLANTWYLSDSDRLWTQQYSVRPPFERVALPWRHLLPTSPFAGSLRRQRPRIWRGAVPYHKQYRQPKCRPRDDILIRYEMTVLPVMHTLV